MSRKAYPSDLTDLQWTLIKELLPDPKTSAKGNRSTKWCGRGVIAGVKRGSAGGGSPHPSVTRRQSRAIS